MTWLIPPSPSSLVRQRSDAYKNLECLLAFFCVCVRCMNEYFLKSFPPQINAVEKRLFFHCLVEFIDTFGHVNVCIQVIIFSYDKHIVVQFFQDWISKHFSIDDVTSLLISHTAQKKRSRKTMRSDTGHNRRRLVIKQFSFDKTYSCNNKTRNNRLWVGATRKKKVIASYLQVS